jgi:predicted alpha/beta superfamily hydrolase
MKNKIIISFLMIFFALCVNTGQAQNNDEQLPQVEIPGTQKLKIYSSIVGQEYDLYINLPRNFNDTSRTFPVIYLLDAQWDFPLVNAIYGEQYYDGFLPEAITVGITWGGTNPNYDLLRARDFVPANNKQQPTSTGASEFLSFIKDELIPFIGSKYKVNPNDRTLMGSSLGGLFTLYTLFNEAELFNRYVLTSPAINWGNGIIFSYEKKYAEEYSDTPVKLFMTVGGYENVESFQNFADRLKEKKYKGLQLKTIVVDGIGHSGSKAEGYTRGLQYVFEKKIIKLNSEILDKYTGIYQMDLGVKISVTQDNDNLVAEVPEAGKIILYAEGEKDFYAKGMYLLIHFQSDDSGKVTGLQAKFYSGEGFVKKIN